MKKTLIVVATIGLVVCVLGLGINLYKMFRSQGNAGDNIQSDSSLTKSSFPVIKRTEEESDEMGQVQDTRPQVTEARQQDYVSTPVPTRQTQPATQMPTQVTPIPQQPSQKTYPVIFHNGTGPMCVEAINYFNANNISYSQYLTSAPEFSTKLEEFKQRYGSTSFGISTNYGYLPIIFAGSNAYSGFNSDIGQQISAFIY
jgi:glutaredoxin-related protein